MAKVVAQKHLGAAVNWFPGHMVTATRDIRARVKAVDLVLEIRDARVPLSSANEQLEAMVKGKRRLIVLNKRELANRNLEMKWAAYFEERGQRHLFVSAHQSRSVKELLDLVTAWLQTECAKEATLLAMVLGVPNVGKSALTNGLHRMGLPHLAAMGKQKRAEVGPLPGVTRAVAGFQVGEDPSTYVMDTPGVMVPRVKNVETGLRLALVGAVKDSVVGEDRLARYLLRTLNLGGLGAKLRARQLAAQELPPLPSGAPVPEALSRIQMHLHEALALPPEPGVPFPDAADALVERQMALLRRSFKIPVERGDSGWALLGKHILRAFRQGLLGSHTLDAVPEARRGN